LSPSARKKPRMLARGESGEKKAKKTCGSTGTHREQIGIHAAARKKNARQPGTVVTAGGTDKGGGWPQEGGEGSLEGKEGTWGRPCPNAIRMGHRCRGGARRPNG